jgi:AcrR family transcriptional regulator
MNKYSFKEGDKMPKSAEQCELIKEKMRTKILESSLVYFAKYGYYGTKINNLAKFIGIGQGTLYCYFSSKEEVFHEILKMGTEKNKQNMIKLQKAPVSAARKIMLLSDHMINEISNDSQLIYLFALNVQVAKQNDFDNPFTNEYETIPNAILANIIIVGQQEGTVVDGDPMVLSDFYWSMVHAMSIKRIFNNQHEIFEARLLSRLLINDKYMEEYS